jgi:hypothetical protein
MRAVFGILGMLVVVAVIGMLAKKQLSAGAGPAAAPGTPAATSPATPQQQVKQFEQAVQDAVQQARPMPDDDK